MTSSLSLFLSRSFPLSLRVLLSSSMLVVLTIIISLTLRKVSFNFSWILVATRDASKLHPTKRQTSRPTIIDAIRHDTTRRYV